MAKPNQPAIPATTQRSPFDLRYLGPPALLAGEDANGYDALMARITAALKPKDAIEEIYSRDVVDLTWEVFRLRRFKAALMQANAHKGIEEVLAPCETLLGGGSAWQTARQWACGDSAARAAVRQALERSGMSLDAARAKTFARDIDQFEQIDRMTLQAERRREAILHDLDRHRASFARPLRRALVEAEDAEFTDVTPEAAA